eukprot:CAMPEP_0172472488 /NCGR_PEP_ID=MMETSP1065-20121228/68364_1 /TAXON_ID=265537 /ORGANISM="Amphiprora paludosa, Strain CCMP125" /LENGTH=195 /DNA_ID=CAMNT_0013230627 /DNA_START=66 /DNA_END=653 /DNA_ORIENTATION=+
MTLSSTTEAEAPAASSTSAGEDLSKSALQDNLERKGKNAYYFAHAHKATGPAWDGKAEPRLLSSTTSNNSQEAVPKSTSTFDYAKSNITSYAFLDEPSKIKLYIELKDVGTKCTDEDIVLDWSERSFSLTVHNYHPPAEATTPAPCLCFARLSGPISKATFKRKDQKIILTLIKVEENVTWHTINDKGTPSHEVV